MSGSIRPFPWGDLPRARPSALGTRLGLPEAPGPDFPALCAALGGPVRWAVRDARRLGPDEPPGPRGARFALHAPGGRRAELVLDPRLAPRLARRLFDLAPEPVEGPRPLTAAEEGALELALAALLPPDLAAEPIDAAAEPGPEWGRLGEVVELEVETPVGTGWARLLVPPELRVRAPRYGPTALGRVQGAWVSLTVELGRVALASDALAGLAPGDVLALGVPSSPPHPVALALGAGRFPAHAAGAMVTVAGAFAPRTFDGGYMEDEALAELRRELPLEVVCELGRLSLRAEDVLALEPGAVLPLGRPLGGPIVLTVGGRVIAEGELVDVEGELGVRVLPPR